MDKEISYKLAQAFKNFRDSRNKIRYEVSADVRMQLVDNVLEAFSNLYELFQSYLKSHRNELIEIRLLGEEQNGYWCTRGFPRGLAMRAEGMSVIFGDGEGRHIPINRIHSIRFGHDSEEINLDNIPDLT